MVYDSTTWKLLMTLFLVGEMVRRAVRMQMVPTWARRAWLTASTQVVLVHRVKRGSWSTVSIPTRDTTRTPAENQNTWMEK